MQYSNHPFHGRKWGGREKEESKSINGTKRKEKIIRNKKFQLSPRDLTTCCVSWNHGKCHQKCLSNYIWKDLQRVNNLTGHSRSLEMARIDRPRYFLLVVCSNNACILHHFLYTTTLRLKATDACQFKHTHNVVNICYIPWWMAVRNVSNT